MNSNPLTYRPEIDGLRAMAVIPVLLFHLAPKAFPGGFVGVDVFFVISGFLVTRIILFQQSRGTFTFRDFYQRRVARLVPTFILVTTTTLLVASQVYSAQDFASCGSVARFAACGLANMKFVFQGGYFKASEDAQPFLHYWSLAVEEQFYLVFPILLLILHKRPRILLVTLTLLFSLSLISCIALTWFRPAIAFYLLPTRAWELLAGGLAAILSGRCFPTQVRNLAWGGRTGLILIMAAYFITPWLGPFPGVAAILPVSGAALIIFQPVTSGFAAKLLRSRFMVGIGLISYSLYMWHWPIFSLVDYQFFQTAAIPRTALKLALTLLATLTTYYLFENPFRLILQLPTRQKSAFTVLAVSVLLFVVAGASIRNEYYVNCTLKDIKQGGRKHEVPGCEKTILLFGDSNGSMYGRSLLELSRKHGFNLVVCSVAAADPLPSCLPSQNSPVWQASIDVIREERPDVVIVACDWNGKISSRRERLLQLIDEISPHCGEVFLISQPPLLSSEATRDKIRAGARSPFFEPAEARHQRLNVAEFIRSLRSQKVRVVEVDQLFTNSKTLELMVVDSHGKHFFQDIGHLSSVGANLVRDFRLLQPLQQAGIVK